MFYLGLHILFDLLVCQFSQQFKDGMLIGLNMTNIMSRYVGVFTIHWWSGITFHWESRFKKTYVSNAFKWEKKIENMLPQ